MLTQKPRKGGEKSLPRIAAIHYLKCPIGRKKKKTETGKSDSYIEEKQATETMRGVSCHISGQRLQSSCFKYVQRSEETMLKEIKEIMVTLSQQRKNID